LALVIQLPPIQIHKGLEHLRELVSLLDNGFRYAVELRHPSWFQDLFYSFFANNDICLVRNQLTEIQNVEPLIVFLAFNLLEELREKQI
jgi:uncharacterized protein YecE (DUF72 family)